MSSLRLEKQTWELQDGTHLNTLEVFLQLFAKKIDKNILCRSKESTKWKPVANRFRLVDSYALLNKLGQGGFGKVYLAVNIKASNRLVAIKIPTDDLLTKYAEENNLKSSENTPKETKTKAKRHIGQVFSQEALLTARLNMCPNVVAVIDHNVSVPYMVLEYCNQGSLSGRLKEPYTIKETISWGRQIATALNAAHSLRPDRLIHRDLKPSNVLIHENILKVSDFGTSKMAQTSESLKSLRGGYTPHYAAPEVFDGKASSATDVWSFGVIMYQLVCGDFPFSGESVAELIMKINFRDFPKLDEAQKFSCPKLLQQMINKCLEKSPEKRLSIAECLDILTKLAKPNKASQNVVVCQSAVKKIDDEVESDDVDFGGLGF